MAGFVQWNFDPRKPDRIPPELDGVMVSRGILPDAVLLAFRTDTDLSLGRTNRYYLVTKDHLYMVQGYMKIQKLTGEKRRKKRYGYVFTEEAVECFVLADFVDIIIEESPSRLLLAGVHHDGTHVSIAAYTFTYRDEAYAALAMLKDIRKYGKILPSTLSQGKQSSRYCSVCGTLYAEDGRCPRCQDRRNIMRRMGVFLRRYRWQMLSVLLLMLISGVVSVLTPYIGAGFFYDQVLDEKGGFYGQLLTVILMILGTALLSALLTIVHNIVSSRIAANLVYDLKNRIFAEIGRLGMSFFQSKRTGALMTQITSDANTIYWFFCDGIPYFTVNLIQVIAIGAIMFYINPLLAALALITVPLVAFGIYRFFAGMHVLHNRRFARRKSLSSLVADVLGGIRTVKAFSEEEKESARFDRRSNAAAKADRAASTYATVCNPLIGILLGIGEILVWGFGGWMVIGGKGLSYGELMTFVAYTGMIYAPLRMFVDMVSHAADSMNAMGRLFEIMDSPDSLPLPEEPATFEKGCRAEVEFKDVSFAYVSGHPVLKDLSFRVPAGTSLGIVGRTGAGKSTLANLLVRLYDPDAGKIYIDGVDISTLSPEELRRNVAIVSQETYLFLGSIYENIAYARPTASRDEILAAARAAGAHDFIIRLPQGYETQIGEGGVGLSGGERQRVSIARAILRNPKILILDEATASMDTETERKVQGAIEALSKGRTTLMIAHRLSTLKDVDRLIVIENGRIAEEGTHLELLSKKGIYHKLFGLQMSAMRSIGIEE
ncbi:MAG: ATP-binding cassette domain-containing protein [Ruminococcaceae bacterium]|nr:ATP-binding cassette domain-containing protein [Oscillospiraceae bacterium]